MAFTPATFAQSSTAKHASTGVPKHVGDARRRRWWGRSRLGVAVIAIVMMLFVPGALAVHDTNTFELDKNATNDHDFRLLGSLGSNVKVGDTAINVCRSAAGEPGTPFTVLVEAERLSVTNAANGNFGGNCSGGTKRTYTVARGFGGTTATGHGASGVSGLVSLITTPKQIPNPGPDWNQVHAAVVADPDTKCGGLGLVKYAFVEDGIGPSTFIGGASKDHLPINGWQHTAGASPDKGEILNAYAAKAIDNGDQILYFGMDRYAVDGSTDIGFWFFKNPVVANPDGTFTGEHAGSFDVAGDILLLGTFTQGGATSNIRVFKWVGSGGNESGTIEGPTGAFGDCVPGAAGDSGCATVNDTSIQVPWNYTFKGAAQGGWIPAGGFMEGGVNLTDLGLDGCFSSFLAETRSSPEITAVLKDFTLGAFEACGSTVTTTPANGSGTALSDSNDNSVPDISIGTGTVSVTDQAVIDVNGTSTWSGTMDFYLCGLVAAPGTCATGGTKIGATQNVTNASSSPVVSAAATVSSVGRYCWRGVFTATAPIGVPNATDSSVTECFEVLPVQPTISTLASGNVTLGSSVSDQATLGGTATKPGTPVVQPTTAGGAAGGSITFRLYGPDDALCTGTVAFTSSAVTVSGNGTYGSGNFTPTAAGTYRWVASYTGDSPNTLGVSGACNDANESVVVNPGQPAIITVATAAAGVPLGTAIDDTATLTGTKNRPNGDPAGGTITFSLYGPSVSPVCTTAIATSVIAVSGDGAYKASDGTVTGSLTPTAAGTYYWIASYSGDSPNTLPVSGACGDANEASLIIQLQPTMDTAQRFVPNDSATVAVASGAGDLAGTVRFRLYDNDTCSPIGTTLYDKIFNVVADGTGSGMSRTVSTDNTTAYTTTMEFSWLVEFTSTNSGHKNVVSVCNNENSSITIDNGSQSNTP